ncbi:PTS sugar transporter subunit IIA [Lucifera butyrica]|uniref:PTS sugar transporter subunit IIA n=1 Tax=Lucifera butyrica TaxID=1351585 RepID=UPI001FB2C267|nr:PTS glucose transporter subunit IIA [Lucifera butyrica]
MFKKRKGVLCATQSGSILVLENVPDPMFAGKMLGDGFAVLPAAAEVYAPVSGEVVSVYDGSFHCYGLRDENGVEVLVHIGIDTVHLKNGEITPKVTQNQKVKAGDLIAVVNLEKIKSAGINLHTMTIISNLEKVKSLQLQKKNAVTHGEAVLEYTLV